MKQAKHDRDTVMLVRGEDRHNHYGYDRPAEADLKPAALEHQLYLEDLQRETAGTSRGTHHAAHSCCRKQSKS